MCVCVCVCSYFLYFLTSLVFWFGFTPFFSDDGFWLAEQSCLVVYDRDPCLPRSKHVQRSEL